MPDKGCLPGYDKCHSCATLKGPESGPLPVSHTDVCCLYKFARQSGSCINEPNQKSFGYDGLCKDCPRRRNLQKQEVDSVAQPSQRNDDVPPEGIVALTTGREDGNVVTQNPSRRSSLKIKPRSRTGFKTMTLECRPPKFKKKLWCGTYQPEEIDRALDGIHFYFGDSDWPYKYADSTAIYSRKPLKGIKFEDLDPSCNNTVVVGGKPILAHKHFANKVKDLVYSVIRPHKAPARKYVIRTRKQIVNTETYVQDAKALKLDIYEAIKPSASATTSSSGDEMIGDTCSEQMSLASSPRSPPSPEEVPDSDQLHHLLPLHPGLSTYEDECSGILHNWDEDIMSATNQLTLFDSDSVVYSESSSVEDDCLWSWGYDMLPDC